MPSSMKMLVCAAAAGLGAASAFTFTSTGALGATLPAGFSEFAITAGANTISGGTAMEFSPDGKLFVLQQGGAIQVYEGSGATGWTRLQTNFLANVPISVDSFFERGMLGIAFDPDYATNRFVYLYYTTATPPVHNRVVRVTANATGDLAVAGSLVSLMELENLGAGNHNGGAIHFGPTDGKLYVAVGENANGSNSQSINNRLGKMLRLNPDPKNPIPDDNPTSIDGIAGTPTGVNQAIWAAGLRNPFTFAFKPGTSVMYINDVGGGAWEEVNVGEAGANYGWNVTEGPFNQGSFPNFTHPIVAYQHSGGSMNFPPGSPVYTGNVIAGGAFYVSPRMTFPAEYHEDYFYADAGASFIKRYDPVSNTVHNFATGAGGPVDLKVGSDGALYYLARGASRVFRVQVLCTSDTNGSGAVDVDDLVAVILAWGPCAGCPPTNCPADINDDCVIDVDDLVAVILNWGACP